ncbi:uncharacterized protein LOC108675030 [Hyalella azteca]|uniref:Serum response factor homolog n=1 Tax=Hyalella azteca TaxID=294128 RepID=A0A979FRR6_HYAAZ|nr:uncharacterized protein LOC108675030 [Hyalella azteca]
MQSQNHTTLDDKFPMNFGSFDPDNLFSTHMGNMGVGMKRSAHEAGLDREAMGLSSDDDTDFMKKEGGLNASSSARENMIHQQTSLDQPQQKQNLLPNGKKTKGRVKIKMEFIDNKLRRYTTFSKRKTGIMKKAYELSTLTGTQVMLLVASETGHVYTFATRKLQPMITSEAGKALIQSCLNSPDPPSSHQYHHHDQRMSATGYEETELTYAVPDDDNSKSCEVGAATAGHAEYSLAASSSASECSSAPASPGASPPPHDDALQSRRRDRDGLSCISSDVACAVSKSSGCNIVSSVQLPSGLLITPTPPPSTLEGAAVVSNAMYAPAADGVAAPLYLPIRFAHNIVSLPRAEVKRSEDSSPSSANRNIAMGSTSDLASVINNSNFIRKLASNDLSISTSVVTSLQRPSDACSVIGSSSCSNTGTFTGSVINQTIVDGKRCRVSIRSQGAQEYHSDKASDYGQNNAGIFLDLINRGADNAKSNDASTFSSNPPCGTSVSSGQKIAPMPANVAGSISVSRHYPIAANPSSSNTVNRPRSTNRSPPSASKSSSTVSRSNATASQSSQTASQSSISASLSSPSVRRTNSTGNRPNSAGSRPNTTEGHLSSLETSSQPSPKLVAEFRPERSSCAKWLLSDDEEEEDEGSTLRDDEESTRRNDDNGDSDVSFQQAFPTDLSMNVKRKK